MKTLILLTAIVIGGSGCAAIDRADAKARAQGKPTLGEILSPDSEGMQALGRFSNAAIEYKLRPRPIPYPQQFCSAVTKNCNPPIEVRIVP